MSVTVYPPDDVTIVEPVTVDAVNLDIRDLSSATDSITVAGTVEITNDVGNAIPVTDGPVAALLTTIRDNADTVEALLTTLGTNTDGLEGFVDGVEALLTTIRDNADTLEASFTTLNAKDFATQTTLASVLAAVDGLEALVASLAVVGAGAEATAQRVTLATESLAALETIMVVGAEKNEDAAHVTGDSGYPVWGVRNDAEAAATSANGDYSPLAVDSVGRQFVSVAKINGVSPVREVTGSAAALNADVIASTEVLGNWVSLQLTGTWIGTITFQGSNDGTNFVSVALNDTSAAGGVAFTSTTSNGLRHGPCGYRYFRARMTAYTSGTATGTAEFFTLPAAVTTMGVVALGSVAHDAVDGGNPLKIGGKANTVATPPANVSAALDRVDAYYDLAGRAVVTGPVVEDAVAASADPGFPILGVRNDAAAARTSTDGDYGMLALDDAGRVGIADLGGTITVDAVNLDIRDLTAATDSVRIGDGTDLAAVNARTDGIIALEVNDDFTSFEAQHVTLVASTDTTITFAQAVRIVRIMNWNTSNRVLVKDGAITSDGDATATRVGKAPATDVPATRTLPFKTTTINLRSAGGSEVTCEGYY